MKYEERDFVEWDATWDGQESDEQEGGERRGVSISEVPSIFSFGSQPINYALDQVFPMSGVTMIAADSGLLKSTLATSVGRAVADGADFAGLKTSRREVLILDRGENTLPFVQDRYRRLGITDGNGLIHYGEWNGDVPVPASPRVIEYVIATDPKPLIVVDSLIAFLEGDENDAVVIRSFMAPIKRLATLGAGVILLHHSGKDGTTRYRGSSDIKASVDVAYGVEGIGDPTLLDGVTLIPFKSRIAVRRKLILKFDGHKFWSDGPERPSKKVGDLLRDLLIANPGIKSKDFEGLALDRKLGRDPARAFLKDGRTRGTIAVEEAGNNAQLHTWMGTE